MIRLSYPRPQEYCGLYCPTRPNNQAALTRFATASPFEGGGPPFLRLDNSQRARYTAMGDSATTRKRNNNDMQRKAPIRKGRLIGRPCSANGSPVRRRGDSVARQYAWATPDRASPRTARTQYSATAVARITSTAYSTLSVEHRR
jgi:hypothetical protein